ncbi:MAG: group II intron reverse transcriptase/maturase [Cytophagales bacterium]|nr:group II intron reverse transcriptase/maturase [Cytophagales bacterium]
METKLSFISKRAREDKRMKFNNLMHLINASNLQECFAGLQKDKAPGVDNMSLEDYGKNLQENVEGLVHRMKHMSYRPQPVRRTYIPKSKGKLRPLGIPTIEDKLVQKAFARILESIWEEDFVSISFGFRPGLGCQKALARLDSVLMSQPIGHGYVIDADIEGYFDNVEHHKLVDCLRKRISDKTFLRYIVRMLRSGIIEDRNYYATEKGTPQGGCVSPILANIYLHYLLDIWFLQELRPNLGSCGRVEIIRYCDDFVLCVEKYGEAEEILLKLEQRLEKGKLKLSKEKTTIVKFERPKKQNTDKGPKGGKPETFNFLGFTHYWEESQRRKGFYKVGRRTECKRLNKAVCKVKDWLRKNRNRIPLKDIWKRISQKLTGHYSYYGVSGNFNKIKQFRYLVKRLLFKWLNRRSQRKSFNWQQFSLYEQRFPLPKPRIYQKLYQRSENLATLRLSK